ncbi:MAG: MaoC family dehydratase N-terminal domain-containing protein [Nakamurella sp.]
MALNLDYVGKAFPYDETFCVGVEKIREFARAIDDDNPLYLDREAARKAGYPDVVAPPTFAIAVIMKAQDKLLFDPGLGLDFSVVVHGDQRFVHHRPIVAGDELTVTPYVDQVRSLGGNDLVTLRTEVTDPDGNAVCTAMGTLVARGAA